MNRRNFVSLLGIAGAVAAIAPKVMATESAFTDWKPPTRIGHATLYADGRFIMDQGHIYLDRDGNHIISWQGLPRDPERVEYTVQFKDWSKLD